MNKYYIQELQRDCTYIELRIFSYIECEEKIKKLTEIFNFLNFHDFLVNLTMLYHEEMRSENMIEHQGVSSLTIDLRDNKFRFKYWDGAKTYWTYHVDDLFNVLIKGRKEFFALSEKYQPITDALFDFKEQHNVIFGLTYKFFPSDGIDIRYDFVFDSALQDSHGEDYYLKKIYDLIDSLDLHDIRIDIDYSFKAHCSPCEEARRRREANEKFNKENNEE